MEKSEGLSLGELRDGWSEDSLPGFLQDLTCMQFNRGYLLELGTGIQ